MASITELLERARGRQDFNDRFALLKKLHGPKAPAPKAPDAPRLMQSSIADPSRSDQLSVSSLGTTEIPNPSSPGDADRIANQDFQDRIGLTAAKGSVGAGAKLAEKLLSVTGPGDGGSMLFGPIASTLYRTGKAAVEDVQKTGGEGIKETVGQGFEAGFAPAMVGLGVAKNVPMPGHDLTLKDYAENAFHNVQDLGYGLMREEATPENRSAQLPGVTQWIRNLAHPENTLRGNTEDYAAKPGYKPNPLKQTVADVLPFLPLLGKRKPTLRENVVPETRYVPKEGEFKPTDRLSQVIDSASQTPSTPVDLTGELALGEPKGIVRNSTVGPKEPFVSKPESFKITRPDPSQVTKPAPEAPKSKLLDALKKEEARIAEEERVGNAAEAIASDMAYETAPPEKPVVIPAEPTTNPNSIAYALDRPGKERVNPELSRFLEEERLAGVDTMPQDLTTPEVLSSRPDLAASAGKQELARARELKPKAAESTPLPEPDAGGKRLNPYRTFEEGLPESKQADIGNAYQELQAAERGRRYSVEGDRGMRESRGDPSTFPEWIPERSRLKRVIDSAMTKYAKGEPVKYGSHEFDVLDALYSRVDERLPRDMVKGEPTDYRPASERTEPTATDLADLEIEGRKNVVDPPISLPWDEQYVAEQIPAPKGVRATRKAETPKLEDPAVVPGPTDAELASIDAEGFDAAKAQAELEALLKDESLVGDPGLRESPDAPLVGEGEAIGAGQPDSPVTTTRLSPSALEKYKSGTRDVKVGILDSLRQDFTPKRDGKRPASLSGSYIEPLSALLQMVQDWNAGRNAKVKERQGFRKQIADAATSEQVRREMSVDPNRMYRVKPDPVRDAQAALLLEGKTPGMAGGELLRKKGLIDDVTVAAQIQTAKALEATGLKEGRTLAAKLLGDLKVKSTETARALRTYGEAYTRDQKTIMEAQGKVQKATERLRKIQEDQTLSPVERTTLEAEATREIRDAVKKQEETKEAFVEQAMDAMEKGVLPDAAILRYRAMSRVDNIGRYRASNLLYNVSSRGTDYALMKLNAAKVYGDTIIGQVLDVVRGDIELGQMLDPIRAARAATPVGKKAAKDLLFDRASVSEEVSPFGGGKLNQKQTELYNALADRGYDMAKIDQLAQERGFSVELDPETGKYVVLNAKRSVLPLGSLPQGGGRLARFVRNVGSADFASRMAAVPEARYSPVFDAMNAVRAGQQYASRVAKNHPDAGVTKAQRTDLARRTASELISSDVPDRLAGLKEEVRKDTREQIVHEEFGALGKAVERALFEAPLDIDRILQPTAHEGGVLHGLEVARNAGISGEVKRLITGTLQPFYKYGINATKLGARTAVPLRDTARALGGGGAKDMRLTDAAVQDYVRSTAGGRAIASALLTSTIIQQVFSHDGSDPSDWYRILGPEPKDPRELQGWRDRGWRPGDIVLRDGTIFSTARNPIIGIPVIAAASLRDAWKDDENPDDGAATRIIKGMMDATSESLTMAANFATMDRIFTAFKYDDPAAIRDALLQTTAQQTVPLSGMLRSVRGVIDTGTRDVRQAPGGPGVGSIMNLLPGVSSQLPQKVTNTGEGVTTSPAAASPLARILGQLTAGVVRPPTGATGRYDLDQLGLTLPTVTPSLPSIRGKTAVLTEQQKSSLLDALKRETGVAARMATEKYGRFVGPVSPEQRAARQASLDDLVRQARDAAKERWYAEHEPSITLR